MGQGNGADKPEEAVRSVHVVNGFGTTILPDNTAAALKFFDQSGEPFVLSFPMPGGLTVLQAMVFDLMTEARNRAAGLGNIMPRKPQQFGVGHDDAWRNCVMLSFDQGLPTEVVYALPDQAGLEVADALRNDIMGRKTPAERAKIMSSVAIPGGGKLIIPGR